MLEMYRAAPAVRYRGLRKLLSLILHEKINHPLLTHKDRLLRFGAKLVFAIWEEKQVKCGHHRPE